MPGRTPEGVPYPAPPPGRITDEHARHLAAIVASSDDAILSKTLAGIITSWNHGAERLYGYSAEEAIGQHVSILAAPDRKDEIDDILAHLAKGDRVDHFQSVRRCKDGRLVDVALTISPVYAEDGQIIGASTIARDITDALRGLRDREFMVELSAALLESSDAQELITATIARLGTYLGADRCAFVDVELPHDVGFVRATWPDAVPGKTSFQLSVLSPGILDLLGTGEIVRVNDTEQAPAKRSFREEGAALADLRAFLIAPLMRHGHCIAVLMLGQTRPREWTPRDPWVSGVTLARLAAAVDLARALAAEHEAREQAELANTEVEMALEEAHHAFSESERSRAELQRLHGEAQELAVALEEANHELVRLAAEAANRAKSDFLAVMSHELRTPLTAIAGYAQLLELGIFGELTGKQVDQVRRIVRAEEQLLHIIEGVLAFTRVEVGKLKFDVEDVPVASAIAGIEILLRPEAEAKHVELSLAGAKVPVAVKADREKLRQVLINLLSNGIKFTPTGGRVRLECQTVGNDVVLRVHDTGMGIPADKLELIFEPFTQLDMGRTRVHGGTGLGLAISREFVRGMDGDISVVSVPGVGSIFSVRVPRGAMPTKDVEDRVG